MARFTTASKSDRYELPKREEFAFGVELERLAEQVDLEDEEDSWDDEDLEDEFDIYGQPIDDDDELLDSIPHALGVPRCRVCGCTDAEACPGGCIWAEPDLCSRCAR